MTQHQIAELLVSIDKTLNNVYASDECVCVRERVRVCVSVFVCVHVKNVYE